MGAGLDIIEAKYKAADEPLSPSTTTSDLRRLIASASRFASDDEANCFSNCSRSKPIDALRNFWLTKSIVNHAVAS